MDKTTAENTKPEQGTGEELYARYLEGDADAFEEFVILYENDLFRFINSIVRDYHEAKHLTIETFAELIVNSTKFTGKSSIKTYLYAIGKNLSMRHIKKRINNNHISFDEIVEIMVDDSEPMETFLEREESRKNLHIAMRELKEEYHAVLTLLYFEDMSYIQAGRAMNKSEKQIKNLAYRAKAALRKNLENMGYE